MRNIHINKLHAKLGHTGEDRMRATKNHLHYSVKETLEVCEDSATAKRKQKLLHKVAKERNLQPVEMIYLDISSQKKPSYGGYNNWILIQDLDTKQKWSLFKKAKEDLTEKVTPFLKKMKTITKNSRIFCCGNAGANNTLE